MNKMGPVAVCLLLFLTPLIPQGVVFQNKYLFNDNVLTDDVVLSQGAYVARPRTVVPAEGFHWVKTGTLLRLRPDAWLDGAWVALKGRRYVEDFWFVAGSGDQVLTIENGSNQINLAIRTDDTGPDMVVLPLPGGLIESNVITLGETGRISVVAHDGRSGLDGVFAAFPPASPGPRPYGGPFAPPADATQMEIAARDRVGNITEKRFVLRRDSEPPEVLIRWRSPESNVRPVAADEIAFCGGALEFSLKAVDNFDKNPRVYVGTGANPVFAPAPEFITFKGPLGTNETFYYYAVDACGNCSLPSRLRVTARPRTPVLGAH